MSATPILEADCTIEIDGDTFTPNVGSSITLDSSAVPYARATFELPLLEDSTVDALDPHAFVRIPVEAGDADGTRSFDLGLRSRTIDHVDKRVTIEVASDEALLQDYASMTIDNGARAFETSLRDVVDFVLDKIGAALEAGTDDADVTAYWAVTNLVTNPTVELDIVNWSQGTNAFGLSRILMTTPTAHSGSYAAGFSAIGAGDTNILPTANPTDTTTFPVKPGSSYVWDFYHVTATAMSSRAAIQWWSADGTVLSSTSFGATTVGVGNVWGRRTLVAVAPPGASHAVPYVNTLGNVGGELHYIDDAMFYQGNEVIPSFNGGTTADANYTYEWSATAHASTSVRTPVVERRPELFVWNPGVSAWEFLVAITASAGMVLWCDELRNWYLSLPENRTIPTLVSVSGSNASNGTDKLSRDDSDGFVSGVVVHYTWRDLDEVEQEAWDAAGTSDKVVTIELKRPYPGPGTAAAILGRRQGTGRKQDVTALANLGTTPGMTANITLPGAPTTAGRIVSVEFDLAGFMTLGVGGLVDVVPGSVAALTGTIDALAGTIDSL